MPPAPTIAMAAGDFGGGFKFLRVQAFDHKSGMDHLPTLFALFGSLSTSSEINVLLNHNKIIVGSLLQYFTGIFSSSLFR